MSLADLAQPPPIPTRRGRVVTANRELDKAIKERLALETDKAVKARKRAYMAKPEVKARKRAYMAKPEVKARQRAYMAKPEVKARKRVARIESRIERLKAELLTVRKLAGGDAN